VAAEEKSTIGFAARLRNGLIVALLLVSPWVFASIHQPTQIALKILGTLLAGTLIFRKPSRASSRDLVLAALTVAILLYGLVSIFNLSLPFLPSSIDPPQSAFTLWGCACLAATFWSVRDWVAEDVTARRTLLWIILLNAALIALAAMAQRLLAPDKVLWLYRPAVTSDYYVFGPFEYRATASQFFNLLWPVAFGLYIQDKTSNAARRRFPFLLLVLLMASPLLTSSRGGLVIFAFAGLILLAGLLISGKLSRAIRVRLILLCVGVAILFLAFGLRPFQRRLRENPTLAGFLSLEGRLGQNKNSWRMVADHPLWGVGPGAYETAFRLYKFKNAFQPDRNDPREQPAWDFFYAKAHNDWLQTLVEWGAPGTLLLILAILLAWVELLTPHTSEPILCFGIATAVLAVLLHGAFDYPLQNTAILIYLATLLGLGKFTAK